MDHLPAELGRQVQCDYGFCFSIVLVERTYRLVLIGFAHDLDLLEASLGVHVRTLLLVLWLLRVGVRVLVCVHFQMLAMSVPR